MSKKVAWATVVDRYIFGGDRTEPFRLVEHDEEALSVFDPGDEVVIIIASEYERLKSYADMYIEQGG